MQIANVLLERMDVYSGSNSCSVIGVCGRAGSGKTTFAHKLAHYLETRGARVAVYSGDWRFFLDSNARKLHLDSAYRLGTNEYLAAVDQYTWYDFGAIEQDIIRLATGNGCYIVNAYDRGSGRKDRSILFPAMFYDLVIYENAILGSDCLRDFCDSIVLLCTDNEECFRALLTKDRGRRSLTEIAARYLITSCSESRQFDELRKKASDKLIGCNRDGRLSEVDWSPQSCYLPFPVDLDGVEDLGIEIRSEV